MKLECPHCGGYVHNIQVGKFTCLNCEGSIRLYFTKKKFILKEG